jgi:4-hydroxybenzoate polyprenyltransferase
MNSRWSIYLKERFPLIPNLLVALGITHSARIIAELKTGASFSGINTVLAVTGGMLFLAQIRLMDEYKDFEKDKIAHPDRPLPRGLFQHHEFGSWIFRFNICMIVLSFLIAWLLNPVSGVLFGLGTLYLGLMFKEFYLGEWLAKRPLLYAISHQLIIFPMGAFVYSCYHPEILSNDSVFWFCLLLLGAFFGFEVGRKLNPDAHPILKTYLSQYGKNKTVVMLLMLLALATHAGTRLGAEVLLGPIYVLTILASSLIWWAPEKFKIVEGIVTLYLLLAIWAIPMVRLFGGFQT